jgi:exodeoxyribonuclease-5
MSIQLTAEQQAAKEKILKWLSSPKRKQTFLVTGEAGTGKTTLIANLIKTAGVRCLLVAFTGKAASVLISKGLNAKTVHSTIYSPNFVGGKLIFKRRKPLDVAKEADLLVIDEISMIDKHLMADLLKLKLPIVSFGDFRQLPPINEDGAYFKAEDADIKLTQVKRQKENSEILQYAHSILDGHEFVASGKEVTIASVEDLTKERVLKHDILICGTNATRDFYNGQVRQILGHEGILSVGEKIIILRNNAADSVHNGEIFEVSYVRPSTHKLLDVGVIDYVTGKEIDLRIPQHCFTGEEPDEGLEEFYKKRLRDHKIHMAAYGYVITCHKSQGSTFENVLVLDESRVFWKLKSEWLYTAVTRASKSVTVIKEA